MLTDPKKPWAKNASLDCKGAEARHLLPALLPVLKLMLSCEFVGWRKHNSNSSRVRRIPRLGKGFSGRITLPAPLVLGKGQMQLPHSGKAPHIHPLAVEFEVPKPQNAVVLQKENFVGQISKLTHSISMGVSSTRLSLKVGPKYRVLLHFKLTRPEFDLSTKLDEE